MSSEGDYVGGTSLIKQLGSCNKMRRDKALKLLLKIWLPSQSHLSEDDMKKLWKGLFYCLWHADKYPVQSDLINHLSSLLILLDLPLSLHYLSVFFITMRREWTGIDALRLDKFYLLIRRFLHSCFLLLKNNCWDLELLDRLVAVLEEGTFLADIDNNNKFLLGNGNGVNYHIASVFLEEIKPFLPVSLHALDVIFRPFLAVMGKSRDKVLVGKVKSNVFDVLLKTGRALLEHRVLQQKSGEDVDFGDGTLLVFGTIGLTMGFAAKFYDLGSSPDCLQGNRKVMFTLHENFLRLEKDLESSGIEILIPEVNNFDHQANVPKLIPIVVTTTTTGTMEVGCASESVKDTVEVAAPKGVNDASVGKTSKKSRRAKNGLDGSNKKAKTKKKKKKGLADDVIQKTCLAVGESEEDGANANGDGSSTETTVVGNLISFNESVISNLQVQFEKVASEVGLEDVDTSLYDSPKKTIKGTLFKKRKRMRTIEGPDSCDPDIAAAAKSGEKSAKKVRFSMKNNLVWKPHSPLPPQSLRLPPSVTPRGSALKKGLSPGPIREMPPPTKKVKQKKKGRKGIKSISPAIKRMRKLQKLSI